MKIACASLCVLLALAAPALAQEPTTVDFPVTDLGSGDAAALQARFQAHAGVTAGVDEEGWLTLTLAPGAKILFSEIQAALEAAGKPRVSEGEFVLLDAFEVILATEEGEAGFAEGAIEATFEQHGAIEIEKVEGAEVAPAARGETTVYRIVHECREDAEGCSFAELREAAAVALLTASAEGGFQYGLVDVRWSGPIE